MLVLEAGGLLPSEHRVLYREELADRSLLIFGDSKNKIKLKAGVAV